MIHEDKKTGEKKPIISICIPSYNREKYLKECLDSIINQEEFNQKDIEIIISDNASPDRTKQLVETYQKKYKSIIYHRNNENIWPLPNILKLADYAHWEYIWFLSDDDMISDIWLKTTLEVIKEKHPWLILSNMFGFRDGKKIDTTKINRKGDIVNVVGMDQFFDFLARIHYDITPYLMAFSLFCFKKEIYKKNLENIIKENGKKYISILEKDYFPHSRIIFVPFWNKEIITIIEKDLILIRWWNISWSFKFKTCKDLLKLIQDLNNKYSINKKTYRKMKGVYYYCVFTYIIISHIRKYIPKFLYNTLIYLWRHILKWIKKIRKIIKS